MTIEEYNQCVDDFADALYRFAMKSLNDSELAKDFIQDSFEKLWMKLPTVQSGKGRAYLFATLHNATIDYHRREKKKTEHLKNSKTTFYEIAPVDLKGELLNEVINDYNIVRTCLLDPNRGFSRLTGAMGKYVQPRTKGAGHGSTSRAFYARPSFLQTVVPI